MQIMIEYIAILGMYVVLMIVALFCIYSVFNGIMEMIRDFLEELHDERIRGNEKETEEILRSGTPEGRTELSGSYEFDESKEEKVKCEKTT